VSKGSSEKHIRNTDDEKNKAGKDGGRKIEDWIKYLSWV